MATLKKVTAKLPSKWAAEGEDLPNGKKAGKGGQVISTEQEISVPQVDDLEDALTHFGGEAAHIKFINEALEAKEIRRQYQNLLAQVKPSDLSLEARIDRAVAAMVKTGFFTIEAATEIVKDRAAKGQLE
jgi:hypothetical protein